MTVKLSKCPVCGKHYGMIKEDSGSIETLYCSCDKAHGAACKALAVIVGMWFVLLILVQFEKNLHFAKKVIDALEMIW